MSEQPNLPQDPTGPAAGDDAARAASDKAAQVASVAAASQAYGEGSIQIL